MTQPSRSTTLARRLALVVGVALTALLGLAGPVAAHTELTGSDPLDGAIVTVAPATVTLTFNETVQNFVPTVVVTGPDGQSYSTGEPILNGVTITTQLAALGPTGTYTAAYRIVSADDHPVTGQTTFGYAPPAAAPVPVPGTTTVGPPSTSPAPASGSRAVAPSATPMSPDTVATADPATGVAAWVWLAGALVVVAVGASLIVRWVRRRGAV